MHVVKEGQTVIVEMPVDTAKVLLALFDHVKPDFIERPVDVHYGFINVRDELQRKLAVVLGLEVNSMTDMHALYRQVEELLTVGTEVLQ